jgi:Questin oxidase-like
MLSNLLSSVGLGRSSSAVNIPSVPVHDIESLTSKRDRRLRHLLKLNHVQHSILYNHLRFHNHSPHLLGSAYLLGGDTDHLNAIYDDIALRDNLEPWKDSPGEIAEHDYRDFLGKRDYQRAWLDFFEDQLLPNSYSWQHVVTKYLFASGPSDSPNHLPMFNSLVGGLGHPLIHLGYAYELNSREIAMEALGLAATGYDPHLASLLGQSHPNPKPATDNLFEVFTRVYNDPTFKSLFEHPGDSNISHILNTPALLSAVLSHYASWTITNPTAQFSQSQHFAAALLVSTSPELGGHGYDFFLVHLLTTSHAVRILLPFIPPQHHVALVQEWFLITLLIYIAQMSPVVPAPSSTIISGYDLKGRDWQFVVTQALEGKHATDAHFVKACRALKAGAETWGDEEQWFLKCAVRFSSEFAGWGGFGEADLKEMEEAGRH